MNNRLFILGDGDNIRTRVEQLLLSGDLVGLAAFSQALSMSIQRIAERVTASMSANVVVAGGDDILFEIDSDQFAEDEIDSIIADFRAATGATISFGIGPTLDSAYVNLRRARLCQKRGLTLSGHPLFPAFVACPPKGQTPFLTEPKAAGGARATIEVNSRPRDLLSKR